MNCEDVLMNFVAANTTGLSPLALGRDGQCSELLDVSALRQSFPEVNLTTAYVCFISALSWLVYLNHF